MQHKHSWPKQPRLHRLFREQLQAFHTVCEHKRELHMPLGHVGVIRPLNTVLSPPKSYSIERPVRAHMDCTSQYKLGERKWISYSLNLPCSLINLHANITWFPATSVFLREQTKLKTPQMDGIYYEEKKKELFLLSWSQKHVLSFWIPKETQQDRHISIVTETSKYLCTENSLTSSLWIKEHFVDLAP